MLTQSESNQIVAKTLLEISEALNEGAAGPCDYWFKQLAERLVKRAQKRVGEARRS